MSAVDRRWLLFAELGASGGSTSERLDPALDFVVRAIPGAAACSITELDGGAYRTSLASSQIALDLDLAQYANQDGPCMTAARDRQQQHVRDTASTTRFTAFAAAAVQQEIRSSLSIPIRTAFHPAALNIYSHDFDGFNHHGLTVADLLGRALTARMHGVTAQPMSVAESAHVANRRKMILPAQEAAVRAGATISEAFGALARRSAREGRSVFDVAADVTGEQRGLA